SRVEAVTLDGRLGRWTLGGSAEGSGVLPTDEGSRRQLPAGILRLNATGDVPGRAHLFASARGTVGGPPEHSHAGVFNLRDTFQNLSPSLELDEAYLDLPLQSLDLRLGKQKFTWGKLDLFQPTDVVDPRDYRD